MPSKFLNISTDNTLGGASASNTAVPSQKAVKEYVDQNSGGAVDGNSITKNSNNQLQAIGLINQNNSSNIIKFWRGTLSQYEQLTPNPDTVYIITDDNPLEILSNIQGYDSTKVQILKNVNGTFMWVEGGTID